MTVHELITYLQTSGTPDAKVVIHVGGGVTPLGSMSYIGDPALPAGDPQGAEFVVLEPSTIKPHMAGVHGTHHFIDDVF